MMLTDQKPELNALRWRELVLFAVLAGTTATFVLGYYYGKVNHIEQLPQIMRAMDNSYLVNDFAVNATSGYGPRFYYTYLLAGLGWLLTLPAAFLVLTCLQNILVALVTIVAARRMFPESDAPALIGVTLVLSVNSIHLGQAAFLRLPGLIPASLVTFLALLALWFGLQNRPIVAAAVAAPAVFIHPLLGLLAGGLGIATSGFASLLGLGGSGDIVTPRSRFVLLGRSVVAAVAFGFLGVLVWVLPQQARILSAREILDIYGYYRAPHHILPSYFPVTEYIAALCFLAASAVSWVWWYRQDRTDRRLALRVLILVALTALLFLGGYLFVEVWPTRLWIVLQTFRLVLVIKWLGLMLIGWTIARFLTEPSPGQSVLGAMMLAPSGFAQPFVVLWGHVAELLRKRFVLLSSATTGYVLAALALIVGVWTSVVNKPDGREFLALLLIGAVSAGFLLIRRRMLRILVPSVIVVVLVALVVMNKYHRIPLLSRVLGRSYPVFTVPKAVDPTARFCHDWTPEDAVFLTPPMLGAFRLTAERAIVVDFKYGMAHDWAIVEWIRRMTDCYGESARDGWGGAYEMDRNYRRITDERVLAVAGKYGADYAVLYRETASGFPVLHEDAEYKVVSIVPVVAMVVFRESPEPVADPGSYFRMLVEQQYPGYAVGTAYVVPVESQVTVRVAEERYQEAVAAGGLPELGGHMTARQVRGPSGKNLTVLFFVAGSGSR